MVFAHGFGCDQNMWRLLAPAFRGALPHRPASTWSAAASRTSRAYDRAKYGIAAGYADDVLEIIDEVGDGPVIFVGHSVSAMIGMLANIEAPERFAAQVMIGPSPCYINDGDYVGGFERADIDALLETLESNYLGWSSNMAPAIMGAPDQPELGESSSPTASAAPTRRSPSTSRASPSCPTTAPTCRSCRRRRWCSSAATTSSRRARSASTCSAPCPTRTLRVIENVGHCPHLSSPGASVDAMDEFLADAGL